MRYFCVFRSGTAELKIRYFLGSGSWKATLGLLSGRGSENAWLAPMVSSFPRKTLENTNTPSKHSS